MPQGPLYVATGQLHDPHTLLLCLYLAFNTYRSVYDLGGGSQYHVGLLSLHGLDTEHPEHNQKSGRPWKLGQVIL